MNLIIGRKYVYLTASGTIDYDRIIDKKDKTVTFIHLKSCPYDNIVDAIELSGQSAIRFMEIWRENLKLGDKWNKEFLKFAFQKTRLFIENLDYILEH